VTVHLASGANMAGRTRKARVAWVKRGLVGLACLLLAAAVHAAGFSINNREARRFGWKLVQDERMIAAVGELSQSWID